MALVRCEPSDATECNEGSGRKSKARELQRRHCIAVLIGTVSGSTPHRLGSLQFVNVSDYRMLYTGSKSTAFLASAGCR